MLPAAHAGAMASGPKAPPPLPPSESSPRELYKLRFMDRVDTPNQPVAQYGSHGLAIAVVLIVAVVIVGAFLFYSLVVGSARMVVSDVTMTPGACQSIPSIGYMSSRLVYRFVLTNPTARNATAALDFYANGQLVDTSWSNPVAGGQSITTQHSVDVDLCNPTSGNVVVRSANYL